MIATYALLALSILSVWFTPTNISSHKKIAPWLALYLCAVASGIATDILQVPALFAISCFGLIAFVASNEKSPRPLRLALTWITALAALALATHRFSGFNNPMLLSEVKSSIDAAPFTLYANFDKGTVGLILLALFCRRSETVGEMAVALRRSFPVIAVFPLPVLAIAVAIGYTAPDFKLPQYTATFLATNLFFSVIAEETFFRGLLQDRLAAALGPMRYGQGLAIATSAALFGLAHITGGIAYVGLATLAGLGYAYIYARTRRIEVPIAAHFVFNAIHFTCLTYPSISA